MRQIISLMIVVVLLAACGGKDDEKSNPPSASSVPQTEISATPEPTMDVRPGGGSTWTPEPQTTPVPVIIPPVLPTAIPEGYVPTPLPESCYQFASLTDDIRTHANLPATVTWQGIDGIMMYDIALYYPGGNVAVSERIGTTSYTFPADFFPVRGVYDWDVWPVSELGVTICYSISGEIIVD